MGIGEYLDLDVAGGGEVSLHVDLIAGEIGHGLALGRFDGVLNGRLIGHHLHAASSTAVGGLDGDWVSVFCAEGPDLTGVGDELGGAGHTLDAHLLGGQPGTDLVAHDLDGFRGWTDEGHPSIGHRPSEVGVFREEAVPRVDRVGAAPVDG